MSINSSKISQRFYINGTVDFTSDGTIEADIRVSEIPFLPFLPYSNYPVFLESIWETGTGTGSSGQGEVDTTIDATFIFEEASSKESTLEDEIVLWDYFYSPELWVKEHNKDPPFLII